MISLRTKWTTEKCIKEAENYNSKKDFRTICPKAYDFAVRNKILTVVNALFLKKQQIF